jgi:hypothetical protein
VECLVETIQIPVGVAHPSEIAHSGAAQRVAAGERDNLREIAAADEA